MKFKSKLAIGVLIGLVTLMAIPIEHRALGCSRGVPSICGFLTNAILAVGSIVYWSKQIESKILPGTEVLVVDNSGNIKKATLSRRGTDGRTVKAGERVKMDCNSPYSIPNGPKVCTLTFIDSPENAEWGLSLEPNGLPDPDFLKFHE